MKKIFKRNVDCLPATLPTRLEEGVQVTYADDGTVTDVCTIDQYGNTVDLDGNVESTTKEVNLKELVEEGENSPFTIDPTSGYTSMKQVKVTAALKDMGTVEIDEAAGEEIKLDVSDTEYGISKVIAKPKLQEVTFPSPKQGDPIQPATEPVKYCGLSKVTVVYGKCTVNPSTYAPTSFSGDTYLNNIKDNGHYPVVITPNDSLYFYGNLDVDADGNNITQVIVYGLSATDEHTAKHITCTRTSTDGGESWINQVSVKELQA